MCSTITTGMRAELWFQHWPKQLKVHCWPERFLIHLLLGDILLKNVTSERPKANYNRQGFLFFCLNFTVHSEQNLIIHTVQWNQFETPVFLFPKTWLPLRSHFLSAYIYTEWFISKYTHESYLNAIHASPAQKTKHCTLSLWCQSYYVNHFKCHFITANLILLPCRRIPILCLGQIREQSNQVQMNT